MAETFDGKPITRQLCFLRGDTVRFVRRLATRTNGTKTYRDLTGCSARLTLRNEATDAVLVALSTGGSGITLNLDLNGSAANGYIIATITPTVSRGLPAVGIKGDLELTYANGDVVTLYRYEGTIGEDQSRA
jgi:hypothetical protein